MAADNAAAFTGTVPEFYDRCMGPVFFDPFAADLVRRASTTSRHHVLELACGTGRLTRPLLAALPEDAHLVATDLNPPMIEHARQHTPADPRLEFRQADAMALPFPNASFDLALCQFGVMFFPDRVAAAAEVRRVLKPGGVYLLNTWASLAENESAAIIQRLMFELFPADPPRFYEVPFGYFDPATIRADLELGGFHDVTVTPVPATVMAASAGDLATGLVRGTPVSGFIAERGTPGHDEVIVKLTERLAAWGGSAPCRVPNLALVARAVA